MTARPFLKWSGGKTQLLPQILERLPKKINRYFEPFVGGGAVFFALAAEKRFKFATLSDSNEELINAYRMAQTLPGLLVDALKKHGESHSEEYFYEIRGKDPLKLTPTQRAARMIYLNKTCFNGLYRVNKSGGFNVPFGDYKSPKICDEENILAVFEALRDSQVFAREFEDGVYMAKPGDVVYFDPPYMPASPTANFTAYTKAGFYPEDHQALRDLAFRLDEKGVHVLLSNADTPKARELYKDFLIEEVQARRNINSKGEKRGNVGELLIRGPSAR